MHSRLAFVSVLAVFAWSAHDADAASRKKTATVDIQLFHPAPGQTGFLSTESGEVNSHLGISTGLYINYGHKPLRADVLDVDIDSGGSLAEPLVENRLDLNLLASIGLSGIGELGVVFPMIAQAGLDHAKLSDAQMDIGADKLKKFYPGDIRIVPKGQLLNIDQASFAVALIPTVVLPTSQSAPFAGEKGVVFAPSLAFSGHIPVVVPLRTGLELGYRRRQKKTRIQDFVADDELFFKFALAMDITLGKQDQPFELITEVLGYTPSTNPWGLRSKPRKRKLQKTRSPLEVEVGLRAKILGLLLTVGCGRSILQGYGTPLPRVFASVTFFTGEPRILDADRDGVRDKLDKCVERAEDKDGFEDKDGCPDPDNDQDGVLDEDDKCALEPEDGDGFEDKDGCPDPDNDQDGVLDEADKCIDKAEDKDAFQDEDGCPDPDNDGDGIADANDKCPNEAEDKDTFEDEDGCPDLDNDKDGLQDKDDICPMRPEDKDGVADSDGCPEENDGDGIPDELDKCPNEAETFNGIDDADGCPEKLKTKSLVNVTKDKIEIKDKVYFRSGRTEIQRRSFKLLDQVASVLQNNKQIAKVRVEGHTDSRGSRSRNTTISRRRAEAVVRYLVDKGIDPTRLEAVGYGPDNPVASNSTRRGRDANRRVEFVIVKHNTYGDSVAPTHSVP